MSFCTPDLAPFITLVVLDMKATALEKSRPLLSNDDFGDVKRLVVVPTLTISISKNRVWISPTTESRVLTRIVHDLSVLSFDSSIVTENGLVMQLTTFSRK